MEIPFNIKYKWKSVTINLIYLFSKLIKILYSNDLKSALFIPKRKTANLYVYIKLNRIYWMKICLLIYEKPYKCLHEILLMINLLFAYEMNYLFLGVEILMWLYVHA